MVPKVAKSGTSFKGAALYYLSDKEQAADRFNRNAEDRNAWDALRSGAYGDRVAFTETHNLPTDDPARAVAHMIDTATHEKELKKAAGYKQSKTQKPVYAYSLSWSPDEAPSMADQITAARETIKELGLQDYQTLIVGHNDTDHPHVHIIVNRVHPETGLAVQNGNDFPKLQKWALEYERARGQNLCPEREKNAAERAKGKWVKHHAEKRREHYEWKKATTKQMWSDFKETMRDIRKDRKPQYQALWDQRENRMATRKEEVKQLFKPLWRDMFKRHREELKRFDHGVIDRIEFALSRKNKSVALGILEAMIAPSGLRHELMKRHEIERVDLGIKHKQTIRDASREVHKAWQFDRDQLKEMHKERDDSRYNATREATDAIWKEKAPANEQTVSQEPEIASQRERVKRSRKRTRKKFADVVRETVSPEELKRAQEEARAEAAKEREQGRDTGRTLTPD